MALQTENPPKLPKKNTAPAKIITKLIRQTFFPVITDFRLPIFLAISPNLGGEQKGASHEKFHAAPS